jgi:RNA polymerase sigma-70 factor (ECF subfamily)
LPEDREECLNDVLLEIWNSIPPDRPNDLRAYSVTILRRRAIDRTRSVNAWKRSGNMQTVGEEFLSTLDDGTDLAADYENSRAIKILNGFLDTLPKLERSVFIMRYCFSESIGAIAARMGSTEGRIKMMLMRTRRKFKEILIKEGIAL